MPKPLPIYTIFLKKFLPKRIQCFWFFRLSIWISYIPREVLISGGHVIAYTNNNQFKLIVHKKEVRYSNIFFLSMEKWVKKLILINKISYILLLFSSLLSIFKFIDLFFLSKTNYIWCKIIKILALPKNQEWSIWSVCLSFRQKWLKPKDSFTRITFYFENNELHLI